MQSGQISVQAEGAEVEFRKLALTPIKVLTPAKDWVKDVAGTGKE